MGSCHGARRMEHHGSGMAHQLRVRFRQDFDFMTGRLEPLDQARIKLGLHA
jgi:hypothetical protein